MTYIRDLTPAVSYQERERQRTVVRRARFQWVWWSLSWAFPILVLGGLLTLAALRGARKTHRDYAPWLHDAKPMLYVYVIPLVVGSIIYSMFR
jgi:hypothetical protein